MFDIKTDFVVEFFSFSLKQKESFLRPLFVLIELKELFNEDFSLNNFVKVEKIIQQAHQHSNVSFEIFNQKIEDAMAIFAFSFVDFSDSSHPVFDFSLPQLHRFHASVLVLSATIELRFSWPSEWMQDACLIDRFEKIIACVLNHDVFSRSDLFLLPHERHILSDVKDHSLASLLSDFSLSSAGALLQRYLESNRSDVLLVFGEHLLSSRAFAIKVCAVFRCNPKNVQVESPSGAIVHD